MEFKGNSKKLFTLLLALALISPILTPTILGFISGISSGGADYVVFEGVAGNDYYDSAQYSYKINQWANETKNLYDAQTPAGVYFNASKSLRIGATEYGEFATPKNAGVAYGVDSDEWADTESWASADILQKYWIQGWLFFMNYTRQGVRRAVEAWAIYSDLTTTEAGRKVYSWYAIYPPNHPNATLTAGSLFPSGVRILYDSARLAVARTEVVIHDGYYDEDVAKVIITIIFNKDTKYAIVLKDVKILLDPKILDSIQDFCFTERYELDMVRGINPSNEAYIHYFHNEVESVYQHPVTGQNMTDAVQAFDPDESYLFFAGYWPNATEYTVYNPLVPNLPLGEMRILNWGTSVTDLPSPPDGPGEPSTPWVIVQWRYNSTLWPNMLFWLAKAADRQMRFVEVVGMTDFNADPHPAMDKNAGYAKDQLDTEVLYMLNQVFNPEDLTTINNDPFMWIGLGQSAATTDSAGAGLLPDLPQEYLHEPFMLFDRNDTMFPWIAPVIGMKGTIPYGLSEYGGNYYEQFSNSGKGTGTDTTLYKRTSLKGFVFGVYDNVTKIPPQPIAGGWSNYSSALKGYYWYPSKDPLTERWWYDTVTKSWTLNVYDNVFYDPNGILSLGGMKANGLTRYFNDFDFAISREGTSAYALINGGTVTGSAPTSDFDKATYDYFPLSTWNVGVTTFGYKEGYAVIALARDVNGTRGLSVYGWDGRDTFWAAAWASQYLGQFNSWIPAGTVALVLNISYTTADREPTSFKIVKALGTITEFGTNNFYSTNGFDNGAGWSGLVKPLKLPTGQGINVWWYEKLSTSSTAKVDFDP